LAKALSLRGIHVAIVGAGPPTFVEFAEFLSVTPEYPISNYVFIRRLWKWLRRNPPMTGSIVNTMRPDDMYPYLAFAERCRLVCTLHGTPVRAIAQRRSLGRLLYWYAERRSLHTAHWVVSVSAATLEFYLQRFPQLSRKSAVIPIGVDLFTFRPMERRVARSELGLPNVPIMLFAGRIAPEKRIAVPIEALRGLERSPLLLIAGGEPRKGDRLSVPENAPVRFLGTVPHHQMPALLSAADVLVLSSSFEGLPTVVLESFACGTPVFATAVGDLPRVLIEGRTGFFFDGTPAGLRNLILRRWDSLHSMRQSCIEAAQAFGWDAIADRIAGVYRHAA
jgi:glycosyltransferase involved in cell wall biosynthesis